MTALKVDETEEAKAICLVAEMKYGKLRYRRVDNLVWVYREDVLLYSITIKNWMNKLSSVPSNYSKVMSRSSMFNSTQIEYHGKPN